MSYPSIRQSLIAAMAIAVALTLASCGGDATAPTIIGEDDMNTRIDLSAGEIAEIRLPSNPSTGFRWVIPTELIDVPILVVDDWHEASETDLVGAPGTDVFRIEATTQGAGVLRLEYRRPFDTSAPPDRVAEFIVVVDDAPWPPENPDRPDTTSVTAPDPDDTAPPVVGEPSTITQLLASGTQGEVTVSGFLFSDDTSWRLCENLLESFPPQCGRPDIEIANPDDIGPDLRGSMEREQGIGWTALPITLTANFDGKRLQVPATTAAGEPTGADLTLVESFLAFASANDDALASIPFASEVALGLGPDTVAIVPAVDLADRATWRLDVDDYDGYAGPFAMLDVVSPSTLGDVTVTIGSHPRCVASPSPALAEVTDARQLSIQPADITSCLEWWAVDFFLDSTGTVQAIRLDLFGP